MMILFSLMLLATEPPVPPEVPWPPVPDFITKVDYIAWYREQLGFALADNAYEDYRLFAEGGMLPDLPDELQRNMSSHLLFPRRWHTGQEPQLAEWLGSQSLALQAFKSGSKRRYYAHGLIGSPKRLLDIQLPGALIGRLLGEATLVESWRLDIGLTLQDWLDRLILVHRFANQLTQGATLIEQLTAMSLKNRVYIQIAFMMKHAVLDDGQLRQLLQVLQQDDSRPANEWLLRALPAEEAMAFELLQTQCLDAEGRIHDRLSTGPEAVQLWEFMAAQAAVTLPDTALESADPRALAASIHEYMAAAQACIRQGVGREQQDLLAKLRQDYAGRSPLVGLLIPSLERAASTALRTELTRRGTQVLVALSIRRRENHSWPESLDAAAGLVPEAMLIDPCSGQPLVYRKTGSRVQLYSVGRDGRDDGGHQEGMRYGGLDGEDLQIYPPVVKSR